MGLWCPTPKIFVKFNQLTEINVGVNATAAAPTPPPIFPPTPSVSESPPPGKSVQFDLSQPSNTPDLHSPANVKDPRRRRRRDRDGDLSDSSVTPTESSAQPSRRRRHRRHSISGNDTQALPRRDSSPSAASDTTVDLPPRFDKHGRRIPERGEDPLADRLNDFLGERGPGGKWINKIVGVFGGDESDGERGGGRRRRR